MRGWGYLFAAFCTSSLGDRITLVALFSMLHGLGGTAEQLAILALLQAVPALLMGTIGGWLAGQVPQRTLLVGLDAARALGLACMALADDIGTIYVLAALVAAASTLYRPVEAVFEMQLVDVAQATRVNAWRMAARQIAAIGGPVVAGLLLIVMRPGALLLVDAASFAVSGALVALIAERGDPQGASTAAASGLGAAARLIGASGLGAVFIVIALVGIVMGMQGPLFFAYLSALFGDDGQAFGLVMSAMAAGSVMSSVAISRISRFEEASLVWLYGAIGLDGMALMAFTQSRTFGVILALSVLLGVMAAVYNIAVRRMLQTWPDRSLRGPLLGLYEAINGLSQVISLTGATLATVVATPGQLLWMAAIAEVAIAVIVSSLALARSRPQRRGTDCPPSGGPE